MIQEDLELNPELSPSWTALLPLERRPQVAYPAECFEKVGNVGIARRNVPATRTALAAMSSISDSRSNERVPSAITSFSRAFRKMRLQPRGSAKPDRSFRTIRLRGSNRTAALNLWYLEM